MVVAGGVAVLALALSACSSSSSPAASPAEKVSGGPTGRYIVPTGIHKIKHVIVIEQENRSFDSYFGTFPGVDGLPMQNGEPSVCVPIAAGGCQKPYHDTADINGGGPHNEPSARVDVNGGKMDGFIAQASKAKKGCLSTTNPRVRTRPPRTSWATTPRPRSRTTGPTPGTSARRPHVRAREVVVTA